MIQLNLQPEIEAQLAAEASARGLQLDRYVANLPSQGSGKKSGRGLPHPYSSPVPH